MNDSMKTTLPKVTAIKRQWHEIDAAAFPVGRLATRVATILRGKHKRDYTPHMDLGDYVVVINAGQPKFTGRKTTQKEYIRFTGYPGGLRRTLLRDMIVKHPDRVIWHAVRNMLAPNKMRAKVLLRLKIVLGDKHTFKIDQKITK